MSGTADLIANGASGLHPTGDLDGARTAAREHGWRVVDLDCSGARDKQGFMQVCREAFSFPDWFGANWDALADSLTDIDDTRGALVLWQGAGGLDPEVRDTAAEVFGGRVALSESGFGPFLVLVGDAESDRRTMNSL